MKKEAIVSPRRNPHAALTLIELLFLLFLFAVLAAIALPVFMRVKTKGNEVKALSNVKQIVLAMRLYASDNNGDYPSFVLKNGEPTKKYVSDSNTAFAQLFPTYVQEEKIFWQPHSAFCDPKGPDEVIDNPPKDTPVDTLKKGENGWAYVVGLNDTSNPAMPLVADGFADPKAHTYTADPTKPGGARKGLMAAVANVDGSARMIPVNQQTMTIVGPNGGESRGDIFTTANAAKGWLVAWSVVVNPK